MTASFDLLEKMEREQDVIPYLGKDRITNLPEGILLHILSFLPTKDSIRTSLVSRRWRYLWKSVPSFNLSVLVDGNRHNRTPQEIVDFVDQALMLRDGSDLKNFSFSYYDSGDDLDSDDLIVHHLKTWIEVAINLKTEVLDLFLYPAESIFELPSSKTLEILRLCLDCAFILQLPQGFGRLRNMELISVGFLPDGIPLDFFSNCPVLETLLLSDIRFNGMSTLNISAPSLRILTVDVFNLSNCEIKVSAPCLVSFKYSFSLVPKTFIFSRCLSLADAEFYCCKDDGDDASDLRLSKLIRGISCVKKLTLRCSFFQLLRLAKDVHTCLETPFANLKYLKIWLDRCVCEVYVRSVIYLLQSCPNLEKLVIKFQSSISHDRTQCEPLEYPPRFRMGHLTEVEIIYFNLKDRETKWEKLLRYHSPVLKQMIIKPWYLAY
ncbi:F-box/LRR-repeat protein At4g14096-like [Aristolochia californica]|uniref:F-box/LRR-repeat protein At4g14096-like n=1 Tax=Aristolochia californica TaxID=171875 RepID=UPI0035E0E8B5